MLYIMGREISGIHHFHEIPTRNFMETQNFEISKISRIFDFSWFFMIFSIFSKIFDFFMIFMIFHDFMIFSWFFMIFMIFSWKTKNFQKIQNFSHSIWKVPKMFCHLEIHWGALGRPNIDHETSVDNFFKNYNFLK